MFAIISFLNGCFHHSVLECILTAIHFSDFLKYNDTDGTFCVLNIDRSYLNYEEIIKQNLFPKLNRMTVEKLISYIS